MNQIISYSDGTYLSTEFEGAKGSWRLIGSESSGDSEYSRTKPVGPAWITNSVANTLDTFTDGKGNYIAKRRLDIFKWAESGDIWLPGAHRKAA